MRVQRIPNTNGIDDIKFIADDDSDKTFLRQLAEAGTLSALNGNAVSSLSFRAISVVSMSGASNNYTSTNSIARYNFDVRQNELKAFDLTFNNSLTDPATPIDLSAFSAIRIQIKPTKGSPALITLSLGAGLTISGESLNVLSVVIMPAQTAIMNLPEYYYDVMFASPEANEYHLEGKIKVLKTATR